MRLPDFIVIGAMKCATSTLHAQLARQPGVFMSTPKEPNFFSDDDVHDRGIEWYAGLFEDAPEEAICGESSTHYTKLPTHPHAAERMAEAVPRARLVYVMRHPMERLVSHYIHAWTKREVHSPIDRAIDQHPELISYGRYSMQLEPYLERFGRTNVLPVFVGRLEADPAGELARIGRFIGLRDEAVWDEALETQNVSSRRLRESRVRDALLNLPGMATLRRRLLPRAVRDRIKKAWRMESRPSLSEAAHRRVARAFDEDLARLGAWLGVELSCGSFDEVTSTRSLEWAEAATRAA